MTRQAAAAGPAGAGGAAGPAAEPVAPVWRRFWVWRPVREFGLAEQPAVDNLHNVYAILHPHAIQDHVGETIQ